MNEVCAECGMRGGNHEMHCTDHPNYVVNGTTGVKLRKSERGRASNALKEALESRDATIGVLAQRGLDLREPHLPGVAMDGGADPTGDADESDDDDFDGDEDGEDEGGE